MIAPEGILASLATAMPIAGVPHAMIVFPVL
jgi:hypothetical protein